MTRNRNRRERERSRAARGTGQTDSRNLTEPGSSNDRVTGSGGGGQIDKGSGGPQGGKTELGSWGEGPRLGLRVERKEAGVGGGLGGGYRTRGGKGLLVWWSREEGQAPLEGGKGDRRGGGAGRPKKPLRPPQH